MKCDHCGKEGALWMVNPFIEEIYGEAVWEWICDSCEEILCDDI